MSTWSCFRVQGFGVWCCRGLGFIGFRAVGVKGLRVWGQDFGKVLVEF